MTPLTWAIVLFFAGVVILLAELVLPSHGLLGVMGAGCVIASVCVAFYVNQWAGLAATLVIAAASPIVGMWVARIWPKTYVGRRLVLPPIQSQPQPLAVQIGQVGVSISELRPMGMCEFEGQRVEASSEFGIIPAGAQVKVVSVVDRRPIVRAM